METFYYFPLKAIKDKANEDYVKIMKETTSDAHDLLMFPQLMENKITEIIEFHG